MRSLKPPFHAGMCSAQAVRSRPARYFSLRAAVLTKNEPCFIFHQNKQVCRRSGVTGADESVSSCRAGECAFKCFFFFLITRRGERCGRAVEAPEMGCIRLRT